MPVQDDDTEKGERKPLAVLEPFEILNANEVPEPKVNGTLEQRAKLPRAQRLTKRQKEFVEALIAHHGDGQKALISMGYKKESARTTVSSYLRHPLIAAEIRLRTDEILSAALPRAAQELVKRMNGKSEYIRLLAAQDVLDRGGVGDDKTGSGHQTLIVNIRLD